MIPTRAQCLVLFDRFSLPSQKRIHVEEVCKLALFFAEKLKMKSFDSRLARQAAQDVNEKLIEAAALLHDIDKNIPRQSGERHPDTAVRVLGELGCSEIAEIVKKHSLHCILDPQLRPATWEEKCVYLADKMAKYELVGVDGRFRLWRAENLPEEAVKTLDLCYPLVKQLEQEVYLTAGISFEDVRSYMYQG